MLHLPRSFKNVCFCKNDECFTIVVLYLYSFRPFSDAGAFILFFDGYIGSEGPIRVHTCAEEEHLVVAVSSHDLVHCHWRVFVVSVGPDHQRSPSHRVDGVEHDRVIPHKGHYIVWELLCCLDVGCEGSARTLCKYREVLLPWYWIFTLFLWMIPRYNVSNKKHNDCWNVAVNKTTIWRENSPTRDNTGALVYLIHSFVFKLSGPMCPKHSIVSKYVR